MENILTYCSYSSLYYGQYIKNEGFAMQHPHHPPPPIGTLDLKVPKCEIFDLFNFYDFYVIKSL
jgi:hypothetical protein